MFAEAEGYGWSKIESTFDWKTFITAKDVRDRPACRGIYASNLAEGRRPSWSTPRLAWSTPTPSSWSASIAG